MFVICCQMTQTNYQAAKDKLLQQLANVFCIFKSKLTSGRVLGEPEGPLEVYATELSKLVNETFPKYVVVAEEDECLRRFIALIDTFLKLKVQELPCNFSYVITVCANEYSDADQKCSIYCFVSANNLQYIRSLNSDKT